MSEVLAMTGPEKFYYNRSLIVWRFLFFVSVPLGLEFGPGQSTYFTLLTDYPGRFIVHVLAAGMFVVALALLPTFVRAMTRTPAVEFDGRRLLIRGWEDRSFDLGSGQGLNVELSEDGNASTVSSRSSRSAKINLRYIEGPRSLVTFLQSLAIDRN